MKVALTHDALLSQPFGGVSRYTVALHRALRDIGVDSTILAPLTFNDFAASTQHVRGVQLPGRWQPRGAPRLFGGVNRAVERAQVSTLDPDVVHLTYYRRRGLPRRRPVVVTVYDMIHERYPGSFVPRDRTDVAKRNTVQAADAILAISESTRRDLIDLLDVEPERVTATPLASGLAQIHGEPVSLPRPYIVHVGGRHTYKNGRRLFQAFAESGLAEVVDLVCFGPGVTAAEMAQLEALHLTHCVRTLTGSDALLASVYRGALAACVPSEAEGFGLPVLEAMEVGVPVACSNAAAMVEVAGTSASYFDPLDVADIAASLRAVVTDETLRRRLSEAGPARAADSSWRRTAELTAGVYQQLVAG